MPPSLRPSPGAMAVVANGLAWAAFLIYLGANGHAPSGRLVLPIPAEEYYLWQAGFVVPVHLAMFGTLAGVCHVLARRAGGNGPWPATSSTAGLAMAIPSAIAWLLPDIIVVTTAGFEALPTAMLGYVPISMALTLALLTRGLRYEHGVSWGRAFGISILGLLAHAVVGAPFLR